VVGAWLVLQVQGMDAAATPALGLGVLLLASCCGCLYAVVRVVVASDPGGVCVVVVLGWCVGSVVVAQSGWCCSPSSLLLCPVVIVVVVVLCLRVGVAPLFSLFFLSALCCAPCTVAL
jgi:hypothetical protein